MSTAAPLSSAAVGRRVRVYWPDEDEWFTGRVEAFDAAQGVFVHYDDGDERWESSTQFVRFNDDDDVHRDGDDNNEDNEDNDSANEDTVEQQSSDMHGGSDEDRDLRLVDEPPLSAVHRSPQMMEPPPSLSDAYDDDDADDDGSDDDRILARRTHGDARDAVDSDDDDDIERVDLATAVVTMSDVAAEDDNSDSETNQLDRHASAHSDDEDDNEQSIAMSEVPITFERVRSTRADTAEPRAARVLDRSPSDRRVARMAPLRAVLHGCILHASGLPSTAATLRGSEGRRTLQPPRAFVKIAFAEASESNAMGSNNLMLRCKQALARTSVAQPSHDPVWNAEHAVGSEDATDEPDGGFSMQLVPPKVPAADKSKAPHDSLAWLQLRGDVLFSVYAVPPSESSSPPSMVYGDDRAGDARPHATHDLVGQAVLSLRDVIEHVLFESPTIVRHLPLQTRQGKPLRLLHTSSYDSSDANAVSSKRPEITVALTFEPSYSEDTKRRTDAPRSLRAQQQQPKSRSIASSSSARSLLKNHSPAPALTAQPKTSNRPLQQQQQQQAKKTTTNSSAKLTTHTSSSTINRRRFAKQINNENVAFAKRIEWQHERRARRADHAKAQAKSKQPMPLRGSMKLDHKASSSVSRSRFQQQVHEENRAMEKRLHAIALKSRDGSSRNPQPKSEPKTRLAIGFDDPDKDKALARDRRQQRQCEHDVLAARAQAKYQQQSRVVDDVMALQADIAALRTQVFTTKASVNRLEILTNKDEHLCKCLRSAAAGAASTSSIGLSNSVGKHARRAVSSGRAGAAAAAAADSSGDAESSPSVTRHRTELELLKTEAASLASDKLQASHELRATTDRERVVDDELQQLTTQLHFVQAKQAFQSRMRSNASGDRAAELRLAQEMKTKQQRLELSRDDEEQWALFQAQQELTQLQIDVQVLKQQQQQQQQSASRNAGAGSSINRTSESAMSAACAYLETKIAKQQLKLKQLELERSRVQREYEALVASGEQDALRAQVQELQQTLFLCQAQHKHVTAAQRHATVTDATLDIKLQREAFEQQTETDVLFKRRR